jgi:hypothetical protein
MRRSKFFEYSGHRARSLSPTDDLCCIGGAINTLTCDENQHFLDDAISKHQGIRAFKSRITRNDDLLGGEYLMTIENTLTNMNSNVFSQDNKHNLISNHLILSPKDVTNPQNAP